ncbi:Imm51 family immunity protein [Nostoc sp.]|uniref:Imm51 family immunity protein n=1 Tax=Nostoc sp. TaxID=1180 RepID=UPI002FF5F7D2
MDEKFEPCTLVEHENNFSLVKSITGVFKEKAEIFEQMGFCGNGYDWNEIVKELIRTKAPEISSEIHYDSEAMMFCVYSDNLAALKVVAQLIRLVINDENLLIKAIENTTPRLSPTSCT